MHLHQLAFTSGHVNMCRRVDNGVVSYAKPCTVSRLSEGAERRAPKDGNLSDQFNHTSQTCIILHRAASDEVDREASASGCCLLLQFQTRLQRPAPLLSSQPGFHQYLFSPFFYFSVRNTAEARDSRLNTLTILHIWFSTEVTFDL